MKSFRAVVRHTSYTDGALMMMIEKWEIEARNLNSAVKKLERRAKEQSWGDSFNGVTYKVESVVNKDDPSDRLDFVTC